MKRAAPLRLLACGCSSSRPSPPLAAEKAVVIKNGKIVPVAGAPLDPRRQPGHRERQNHGDRDAAVQVPAAGPRHRRRRPLCLSRHGRPSDGGRPDQLSRAPATTPTRSAFRFPIWIPFDALNPEDETIAIARVDGVTSVLTAAGGPRRSTAGRRPSSRRQPAGGNDPAAGCLPGLQYLGQAEPQSIPRPSRASAAIFDRQAGQSPAIRG